MKPEIVEGVVSNTVSGVARHEFFVVSSGVGLARAGVGLPSPPIKGSDKASVSLTGSSPAYPVARQTIFTPPLNPNAGHNGAQFLSFKKITPLVLTVRRTTMPEVGLAPFNPTPPSDFRLTHDAVRGSAFASLLPPSEDVCVIYRCRSLASSRLGINGDALFVVRNLEVKRAIKRIGRHGISQSRGSVISNQDVIYSHPARAVRRLCVSACNLIPAMKVVAISCAARWKRRVLPLEQENKI